MVQGQLELACLAFVGTALSMLAHASMSTDPEGALS